MYRKKQPPECIVILQDVGKNMEEPSSTGEECLKFSKNCIMQIMLRKLFSESQDEFALITFGSETTKNKLANGNNYRGIEVKTEHFTVVNRAILTQVENIRVNSKGEGDWLDAILVAIQFLYDESDAKPYSELKIVIFSNFHNSVNDEKVDVITKKMKEMKIDLTVIGPDVPANISTGSLSSSSIKQGEIIISTITDELQGTLCSFKDAYTELENLQRKAVRPTPWNSILVISSKIKIPIRAFKKIAKPKAHKWNLGTIDDEHAAVQKERAYVKFDETNETEIEIEKEELIDAYQFGSTIVPFSDIDKDSMTYKSGPKGLYLVGCTSRDSIPQNLLMGEGTYIILARQDDQVGNHMLQSLIQAMHENDIVGIARRVYSNDSTAYLGALFPYVTDDSRYLLYAQLPFAEDEHIYKFSGLDSTRVTDDEMKSVDDFINAMDLDEIDSDDELYDLTRTYDPHEQYTLKCLGHKYVHPQESIPDEIKSDMAQAMQPKLIVTERSKLILDEIIEKFPLERVIKKSKDKFNTNAVNDEALDDKTKTNTLFQKTDIQMKVDEDIASTSDDHQVIQNSIETVISKGVEKINEFEDMLKSLRRNCCSKDTKIYNKWLPEMKKSIKRENLERFWNVIVKERLGLITKSESPLSNIGEIEAKEFLKVERHEFKAEEADSVYGSIEPDASNDDWLDDL